MNLSQNRISLDHFPTPILGSENDPSFGVGKRPKFQVSLSTANVLVDLGPFSDPKIGAVFRPQIWGRKTDHGFTYVKNPWSVFRPQNWCRFPTPNLGSFFEPRGQLFGASAARFSATEVHVHVGAPVPMWGSSAGAACASFSMSKPTGDLVSGPALRAAIYHMVLHQETTSAAPQLTRHKAKLSTEPTSRKHASVN